MRHGENICIDMIKGAVAHYKQFDRPIDYITLSANFWLYFLLYIGENKPELYDDVKQAGQMDFHNVKIRKGPNSMFQRMTVELKQLIPEA